jgi:hypothetical protein
MKVSCSIFQIIALWSPTIEEGFSILYKIFLRFLNPKKHLSEKEREEIFPTNLFYTKTQKAQPLNCLSGLKYTYLVTHLN